MVQLYKSPVLSYLESFTAAIVHAQPGALRMLDRIQEDFLEAVGLSAEEALICLFLAPFRVRRNMPMLGLLCRVTLGLAPAPLAEMFLAKTTTLLSYGFGTGLVHGRQLEDRLEASHLVTLHRSIFGMVRVYSCLLARAVAHSRVKAFQRALQKAAIESCKSGKSWQTTYDPI